MRKLPSVLNRSLMLAIAFCSCLFSLVALACGMQPWPPSSDGAGEELVAALNDYRGKHGLEPVPLSLAMMEVARVHVEDLRANNPATGECNLHSWSDQGDWTPCCYTDDHAEAECMWIKPQEITGYSGSGFEISAAGWPMTPAIAVAQWRSSPEHRAVVLNEGKWEAEWHALGAAIVGSYAVAWFGRVPDPAGSDAEE